MMGRRSDGAGEELGSWGGARETWGLLVEGRGRISCWNKRESEGGGGGARERRGGGREVEP